MRRVTLALLLALALLVGLVGSAGAAEKPITVIVDGKTLSFDVTPYQTKGTTMVPMRAIFEALGATVEWDEKTQSVAAVKGDTTIVLTIGKAEAKVKGKAVALAVPAVKSKGKTMVPLRFVTEALGAEVNWDGATRTITIVSAITGAVNQDALKLLQQQDVDYSGWITVIVPGFDFFNFEAHITGSSRKNHDEYASVRAKNPLDGLAAQDIELAIAIKDNVMYWKGPIGKWSSLVDHDMTLLNKMGTNGALFKEVKFAGDETLGGKIHRKIVAVFSPDFASEMVKTFAGRVFGVGNSGQTGLDVKIQEFEMTVLIDPITDFQRRTGFELVMSITDPASGIEIPLIVKLSGQFDLVQNTAPIQFPDLSGAVKSELPRAIPAMPGMGK